MSNLSHLGGWIDDPRGVEKSMSSLPVPVFSDVWSDTKNSGKGKKMLLYDIIRKVAGKFPNRHQTDSDCVSQGAAYAIDSCKCVDIFMKKEFELWVAETATEDIYSGSRNIIGKGKLGNSGGSLGVWAAQYANEYGGVARGKYGDIDLSIYDGTKARSWGRQGFILPKSFLEIAKKHPILTVSQVNSWEEVRDLIFNGYAVTIASNQGFSEVRDSDGFAAPKGEWAHQMCCSPDTMIKGFPSKKIKDVVVNDLVYDKNGNKQTVTEVYCRPYSGDMVKIKISGRESILLTPNHPVLVFRKESEIPIFHTVDIQLYANKSYKESNRNSKYDINKRVAKWIEAKDLVVGDWTICPKINGHTRKEVSIEWNVSQKAKKIPKKINLTEKVSWFLGLFAADGGVSKGHKIGITLHKDEENLILAVQNFFLKEFGIESYKEYTGNACRVICCSSIVANTFYDLFQYKTGKKIPDIIMSYGCYESFIKGFLDGDGSIIDESVYKITNCNPYMIEDLHTMMICLGLNPYINKLSYDDKNYGNKNWSSKYEIRWSPISKRDSNWWSDSNYIGSIRSTELVDFEGSVYNIEVENTHTYIANGYVVHNCLLGMDDESGRPGALCQNSWGNWNSGPKRHDQPDGSFWIDAEDLENRILKTGDCWAYSGYEGFRQNKLNTRII